MISDYVDPVFNADNRHLEKMFDVLKNQITQDEADQLLAFAKTRTSTLPEGQSVLILYNRPDGWDETGVVDKIYKIARQHIMDTYWMIGNLEPRSFCIVKTEGGQEYEETYGNFDDNGETLYTAITTVPGSISNTVYTSSEISLESAPTDIIVHRNERINNWKTEKVNAGTRYDLVILFQEPTQRVSYDFEIEQSIDDDSEF